MLRKFASANQVARRELTMQKDQREQKINAIRHDLVNILTMIRGYAELTLMRESLDPVSGGYSRQIVIAVDRAFLSLEQLSGLYSSATQADTLPGSEG